MSKVIQLTDPHLSKQGFSLQGLNPQERLKAAFEDIMLPHGDSEACIISGDLTDSASPGITVVKRFISGFSNFYSPDDWKP